MTPRAERTQKMTKIFKKLEKIVKNSIKLRVFSDQLATGGGGCNGGNSRVGLEGGNSALGGVGQ